MRKYRRDIAGAFLIAAALALCGCSAKSERPEDIVVLYTGDVHCAVDENTGYAGLAAYKKQMEEKTPYVTLVDCGDAIQGDAIGLVSKGEYPVQIMNRTGYDLAVWGITSLIMGWNGSVRLSGRQRRSIWAAISATLGTGKMRSPG